VHWSCVDLKIVCYWYKTVPQKTEPLQKEAKWEGLAVLRLVQISRQNRLEFIIEFVHFVKAGIHWFLWVVYSMGSTDLFLPLNQELLKTGPYPLIWQMVATGFCWTSGTKQLLSSHQKLLGWTIITPQSSTFPGLVLGVLGPQKEAVRSVLLCDQIHSPSFPAKQKYNSEIYV